MATYLNSVKWFYCHTGNTTKFIFWRWSLTDYHCYHGCLHFFFCLLCYLHVLLLHSTSSFSGLSEWYLSHLEKWHQPTSWCYSARLWKHGVDTRAKKLHLQRRWCASQLLSLYLFFFCCICKNGNSFPLTVWQIHTQSWWRWTMTKK